MAAAVAARRRHPLRDLGNRHDDKDDDDNSTGGESIAERVHTRRRGRNPRTPGRDVGGGLDMRLQDTPVPEESGEGDKGTGRLRRSPSRKTGGTRKSSYGRGSAAAAAAAAGADDDEVVEEGEEGLAGEGESQDWEWLTGDWVMDILGGYNIGPGAALAFLAGLVLLVVLFGLMFSVWVQTKTIPASPAAPGTPVDLNATHSEVQAMARGMQAMQKDITDVKKGQTGAKDELLSKMESISQRNDQQYALLDSKLSSFIGVQTNETDALKLQVGAMDGRVGHINDSLAMLQQEVSSVTSTAKRDIADANVAIGRLQQSTADTQETLTALQDLASAQPARLAELEGKYNAVKAHAEALQKQLQQQTEHTNRRDNSTESALVELRASIDALRSQLDGVVSVQEVLRSAVVPEADKLEGYIKDKVVEVMAGGIERPTNWASLYLGARIDHERTVPDVYSDSRPPLLPRTALARTIASFNLSAFKDVAAQLMHQHMEVDAVETQSRAALMLDPRHEIAPGSCFPFYHERLPANVTVKFALPIWVSSVSYHHVSSLQTNATDVQSAPKQMHLFGHPANQPQAAPAATTTHGAHSTLPNITTAPSALLPASGGPPGECRIRKGVKRCGQQLRQDHWLDWGAFVLDHPAAVSKSPVVQMGGMDGQGPVDRVTLQVASNHGSDFVCLYRLRVYGTPAE